ncbi:MAG: sulfatase-like hydrolase/transferase [Treponema sp.]|nr:sulfatase-like hydrolase/transferase [Treponema sp.]
MEKPDILVFMSDQHNAMICGYAGDKIIRTPNMDDLARCGTVFDAAYTSFPLCVPARISFMTGQLAHRNGFIDNAGAIPEDQATFIHSVAAEGYETVLCGRMHFLGADQRHGFTKRFVGDITPQYWGTFDKADWGCYHRTNNDRYFDTVGGGDSPVLAYDRSVITAAVDYLSKDHDKPQCVVVGTYGPHSTYVAPPDLYSEYLNITPQLAATDQSIDYDMSIYKNRREKIPDDLLNKVRAAYYGMITTIDSQLGEVRRAWDAYLKRQNRKGIFVYLSDHGDQIGERYLFNKVTFFDGSAKIPLIFAGDGIKAGVRIKQPVSLLDISPTVCQITGAELPPEQDGIGLAAALFDGHEDPKRYVISESRTLGNERMCLGRMIRQGKWKYITYSSLEKYDLLFDMEKDPYELHNCIKEEPAIAADLYKKITDGWDIDSINKIVQNKIKHHKLLARWGMAANVEEEERYVIPESALKPPVVQ